MRIRIEHNNKSFEYEREPLPEKRFKAVCWLSAAGVYAGMVAAVASLCGEFGLLLVMFGTVLTIMVIKGID